MPSNDSSCVSLLTTEKLNTSIRAAFEQFPDVRRPGNHQTYTVADAALSAFAVFFTQSPSFLDYQVRMQQARGRNNADSLFGVHQLPSTPQIRTLLEPVSPDHLAPLFMGRVGALDELGELECYRSLGGALLIPLDGTE